MAVKSRVVSYQLFGDTPPEVAEVGMLQKLNESRGSGTAATVRVGTPIIIEGNRVRVMIDPPSAITEPQMAAGINIDVPGVSFVQTCFDQFKINDVTGISTGGSFPTLTPVHSIFVEVGVILAKLLSTGFVDVASVASANAVIISIFNQPGGTDIIIPQNATISIVHAGGTLVLTFTKALTIRSASVANGSTTFYNFFPDVEGQLTIRHGFNGDGSGGTQLDFPREEDFLVACQEPERLA